MRAGENDSICHSKISKCHQQKIIVEVFLHQLHWWCSRQKSEFERNWKLKADLSRLSQRFSNGTATYKHRLLLCEPRLQETNTGSQSPGTFSWPQFTAINSFSSYLLSSLKKYPKRIFSPSVLVVLVKEISGEDKSCFFVTDRSSPPTFLHSQSSQWTSISFSNR